MTTTEKNREKLEIMQYNYYY